MPVPLSTIQRGLLVAFGSPVTKDASAQENFEQLVKWKGWKPGSTSYQSVSQAFFNVGYQADGKDSEDGVSTLEEGVIVTPESSDDGIRLELSDDEDTGLDGALARLEITKQSSKTCASPNTIEKASKEPIRVVLSEWNLNGGAKVPGQRASEDILTDLDCATSRLHNTKLTSTQSAAPQSIKSIPKEPFRVELSESNLNRGAEPSKHQASKGSLKEHSAASVAALGSIARYLASEGSSRDHQATSDTVAGAKPRYFDRYSNFQPNDSAPIQDEFNRFAKVGGWAKGSDVFLIEQRIAYSSELQYFIHGRYGDVSALERVQAFCKDIGITSPVPSMNQCKKALNETHVNIFDYIDCCRKGIPIHPVFHTKASFRKYTKGNKVFPKLAVKDDPTLGFLLKKLFGH